MSNKYLCKGKHLKIEDRLIVEYGLDQNYTLKEIAEKIKKDPTTTSKEIALNRFLKVSKRKKMVYNHANTEKVVLKQTCVIVVVESNVKNVDL